MAPAVHLHNQLLRAFMSLLDAVLERYRQCGSLHCAGALFILDPESGEPRGPARGLEIWHSDKTHWRVQVSAAGSTKGAVPGVVQLSTAIVDGRTEYMQTAKNYMAMPSSMSGFWTRIYTKAISDVFMPLISDAWKPPVIGAFNPEMAQLVVSPDGRMVGVNTYKTCQISLTLDVENLRIDEVSAFHAVDPAQLGAGFAVAPIHNAMAGQTEDEQKDRNKALYKALVSSGGRVTNAEDVFPRRVVFRVDATNFDTPLQDSLFKPSGAEIQMSQMLKGMA